MLKVVWVILTGLFVAGCAGVQGVGIDARDRVVERATVEWCTATPAEKEVIAQRREYSEEWVGFLESKCEEQE